MMTACCQAQVQLQVGWGRGSELGLSKIRFSSDLGLPLRLDLKIVHKYSYNYAHLVCLVSIFCQIMGSAVSAKCCTELRAVSSVCLGWVSFSLRDQFTVGSLEPATHPHPRPNPRLRLALKSKHNLQKFSSNQSWMKRAFHPNARNEFLSIFLELWAWCRGFHRSRKQHRCW